MFISLVHKLN